MIKVSAVIVSWNKAELTLETLRSLAQSKIKGFDLEIVLVDNGSVDDTVVKVKAFFKKLGYPHISSKLIINNKNLGFVEGNNQGITYAIESGAEYILILNDDTNPDKDMLYEMVNFTQNTKEAGAVTPKIYFAPGYEFHKNRYTEKEKGRVIWYAGGNLDWNNVYGSNYGVDEVDKGQFEKVREIDFASGCAVLFPAIVLKKTGLFDTRYFAYLEDVDLSLRIKKHGYKLYYLPVSVLWHKVSQSSGIGSELNDYFITRNRMLLGFTYAPLRTKFALFRESIRFLISGRKWQKKGVEDFYMKKFARGSWEK